MIKEYFANYFLHSSDVTFDMSKNEMKVHHQRAEDWKVTLIDTGENSMTGGRLLRVRNYLKDDKAFCLTYGDGIANINIKALIKFHLNHGKKATLTAIFPPGRFGALNISGNQVVAFEEKPKGDGALINGGYFVLSPEVFDLIEGDNTIWEKEPLKSLAACGELMCYRHEDFWQPMDTLRDKNYLQQLWDEKRAPWKIW